MPKIHIGQTGTFYPIGHNAESSKPQRAKVTHVWSDTCVNLLTEKSDAPTSVLVLVPGQVCAAYYFVPDPADPTEAELVARGLTAPRVTAADIEANIAAEYWFTAAQAVGEGAPAHESLGLLTFCVLVLRNGFTVTGESACASPENFDADVGRKIARQNAVAKVWPLMGYELRTKLATSKEGA